jgi:hypothetical protein
MNHLPPRSEESTKKMQQGHRKGRSRPSNLHEQVDPEIMKMWPTPVARDYKSHTITPNFPKGFNANLATEVEKEERKKTQMWPTPTATERSGINPKTGKGAGLTYAVKKELYPTPTSRDWRDTGNLQNTEQRKDGRIRNDSLPRVIANEQQIFPTPNAWDGKRGPQTMETLRDGNHQVNLIDAIVHDKTKPSPKGGGSLNPKWVAWLMGYPTEYLSSVPWETRSSRKSSKKSD